MLNNSKIDMLAFETTIVDELARFPGVLAAVASSALVWGVVVDNYLTRAIIRNYNPRQTAKVQVVFEPDWFIVDLDVISVAVVHDSPWPYNTLVPIIFAGHKFMPQHVSRRVHTVAVALTLANIVGTKRPSGLVAICFWK